MMKQDFERAQQAFLKLRLLPESKLHSLARMQLTNLALSAPDTFQKWYDNAMEYSLLSCTCPCIYCLDTTCFACRFDESRCYDPDSPALQRQAELFDSYHGNHREL
jgi:hypothetical protein